MPEPDLPTEAEPSVAAVSPDAAGEPPEPGELCLRATHTWAETVGQVCSDTCMLFPCRCHSALNFTVKKCPKPKKVKCLITAFGRLAVNAAEAVAKALPERKGRAPAKKGAKKGARREGAPEEEQAHAQAKPSVAAVSPDAAGEQPEPGERLACEQSDCDCSKGQPK